MDCIDNALIETRQKLREARTANDKLRGSLAILGDQYKSLERENARLREAARRAVRIAREGRYSAANLCEVVQAMDELERLSSA